MKAVLDDSIRGGRDHNDVASAPFRSIGSILFAYNSLFFGLNKSFYELNRMKEVLGGEETGHIHEIRYTFD